MGSQLPLNVALVPPPIFLGHLIPFIELANKLVSHHNCTVTLILPDGGAAMNAQKALLQNLPTSITPIFLPPPPPDDLPEHEYAEVLVSVRFTRSLPALRRVLSELAKPPAALVVDLLGVHAFDLGKELGIPIYIFYIFAAYHLLNSMEFSKSDDQSPPAENLPPLRLPGSESDVVGEEDFTDLMKENKVKFQKWAMDLGKNYPLVDGILVNSYLELETAAFDELEQRYPTGPPIFRVGPLIQTRPDTESDDGHYSLKWLDDQPPNSVLYVSFGSGGTLSSEQIKELALGLEISNQRFLWILRSPKQNTTAAYLSVRFGEEDPVGFLPEGFLERTKGRGLVAGGWVPQIRILSHGSVGGFVTHCGWNSVLEGVVFGVPLIAWPICFDQRMTATYLVKGRKIAIRVRENENGVVEKESVSKVVKELMEGEEGDRIRRRMLELKSAASVMGEQGCSTKALDLVVKIWYDGNKML